MTDVVAPAVRSRMMSGIKAKNSKPEMIVRRALFAAGYRFRLHRTDLVGSPDVVLPGRKIAVFVHGCFWHRHDGCRYSTLPSTRPAFWKEKLDANARRDRACTERLNLAGWRVLWVWECSTRHVGTASDLKERLRAWIEGSESFGEISGAAPS